MSTQLQVDEVAEEESADRQTDRAEGATGDASADDVPVDWPTDDASVGESLDVTMSEEAASAFLERRGWGCLTLADGGVAYSIPMSFGYDGEETLYFQMQTADDSRKLSFLDATRTATFLVPEVRPPEWTSVIARGEIAEVPDGEREAAYAAFADNAWFPMCPWTAGKDPANVTFYALRVRELTGRTSTTPE